MKLLILSLLFLTLSWNSIDPSNYLNYHTEFSQVETLIVSERFEEAQAKIEKLFEEYEVNFLKDYVIAAQIALVNKDKEQGITWLKEAIKKGATLECLKDIKIIETEILASQWEEIETEYQPLRKEYLSGIDLKELSNFSKRYLDEQDAKRSNLYPEVVQSNFDYIHHLIKLKKYPSERTIGIDNDKLSPGIFGCDFGNSKVTVTLLHYTFPISEIGESQLMTLMKNGELHPRDFANVYSFEKNKISVLYRKAKKDLPLENAYHFNFPFCKKHENIRRVNMDRALFGICKYEVDQKKEAIEDQYGLKLRFGYR